EAFLSKSIVRGLRAGLIGGLIGLVAGGIALPLSEFVFLAIVSNLGFLGASGEVAARALGWAIFGGGGGVGDGIIGGAQMWKSAVGGLIGGAVGGLLLELTLRQFSNPLVGKVAGLILLGASIGALTALIVVALSRAWLEVKSGKLIGTEFIL